VLLFGADQDDPLFLQAASDLFLGWSRCGRVDYLVRQLRDMKASVALEQLDGDNLTAYAELCGWVLVRAHACSGDATQISSYLGKGKVCDRAMAAFGEAFADQTERDYAALIAAGKAGRVKAVTAA
jgi:hypothetical protein